MKKSLPFLAGMLTAALIGGLGVTALAASGAMTITVDPINVQVNGQVFAPKDVNGQDVPVFSYNGTTYAPLRALAEAYGLEVGYDAGSNMATVTGDVAAPGNTTIPAPDTTAAVNDYSDWTAEEEAAYQEFKGMWDISFFEGENHRGGTISADYIGPLSENDAIEWLNNLDSLSKVLTRYSHEVVTQKYNNYDVLYFGYSIGKRICYGGMVKDTSFGAETLNEIKV